MSFDFPRGTGDDGKSAPFATACWSFTASPGRPGDIWLGRDNDGVAVGTGDDRHADVTAGSRSGKNRSAIIPNLFLWPGSALVIDPALDDAIDLAAAIGDALMIGSGDGKDIH